MVNDADEAIESSAVAGDLNRGRIEELFAISIRTMQAKPQRRDEREEKQGSRAISAAGSMLVILSEVSRRLTQSKAPWSF